MKNTILASLLFTLSAVTQAQNQVNENANVKDKWEKYSTEFYSIDIKSSWEKADSKEFGTEFIFLIDGISDELNFRENINLLIQNLGEKNIDLDGYVSISEDQIKTMLTNAKIIESSRIKGDTYESHKIIFTGDQGVYKLKFEQRYIIYMNKAYVLTFTSQETNFNRFLSEAEIALSSFNFLK